MYAVILFMAFLHWKTSVLSLVQGPSTKSTVILLAGAFGGNTPAIVVK